MLALRPSSRKTSLRQSLNCWYSKIGHALLLERHHKSCDDWKTSEYAIKMAENTRVDEKIFFRMNKTQESLK